MADTNALSTLLNLLIGSGRAAGRATGSSAGTAAGKASAKLQNTIAGIQKDIRESISSNLPVFYLLNAEVIVDSMLAAIDPKRGNELSKFLVSMKESSSSADIYEFSSIQGELQETKNAFGTVISTSSVGGFTPLYTKKYNKLISQRSAIIKDVTNSLQQNIRSTSTMLSISNYIAHLNNLLAKKITALSQLPEEFETKARSEGVKHTRAIGALLRKKFKDIGTSRITDADFFLTNYNGDSQVLVVGSSYNNTTTVAHNIVTEILESYLKDLDITVASGTSGFKAGNFAAAGHSGLRSGSSIIGINTPLTQIASMILANNNLDAPGIMDGFIMNTGHKDWAIEVNESYTDAGKMVLNLGISFLQSQPSVYNSETLSPEEVAYFKTVFKKRFDKDYAALRKELTKSLKDPKVFSFIFKVFRMSPTLDEAIVGHLKSALTGKPYKGPKGSGTFKDIGVDKLVKIPKVSKPVTKGMGTAKSKKIISEVPLRITQGKLTSLASLQTLLNLALAKQIQQNMGTGTSRNVLNYRTGRLAESAQVTTLSQSREGMITAFYTYQRNPYGTFSEGGAQSSPKTRDPKLLISKSIREVLSTQVNNRLRAVLA